MLWRQPMVHFTCECYDGNLYSWLEGGNHSFSIVDGFRLLMASGKVDDV